MTTRNIAERGTGSTARRSADARGQGARSSTRACRALLHDGAKPVGWEPCSSIGLMLYTAHMPPGGWCAVATVLGEIHAASGYGFRIAGVTSAPPPWENDDRLLTVGWVTSSELQDLEMSLESGLAGVGGVTARGRHIVSGFALIRAQRFSLRRPSSTAMGTIRHELGHAMGLGHVDDPRQVMYPVARTGGVSSYGDGDLAGFRALAQAACTHRRPEPGPSVARRTPG